MKSNSKIFVFAGPTLFGIDVDVRGEVNWRPPVRRGDITALIASEKPATIAIADGTFHAYPSVSHIEIRDALESGWIVYGLCSMGAIRACEMRHLGMRPWGVVAEMFCTNANMPDDEVALVHGAEFPHLPLSEPMVHLRAFLRSMFDIGALSREQVIAVEDRLTNRWYGERTLYALKHEIEKSFAGASVPQSILEALSEFAPHRLKQHDLKEFMIERPWLTHSDQS